MSEAVHSIDLLPESIRERNRAAARAARTVAVIVAVVAVVGAVSLQARVSRTNAVRSLTVVQRHADQVLKSEAQAARLRTQLRGMDEWEARYRALAYPVDASAIIATVTARMPKGTSLDRLDLDAGARRQQRTARSRGPAGERTPRTITVELSGFAPSDAEVASFIKSLKEVQAFRAVSLDFSRTRLVRETPAREFRLSFRVPLDEPMELRWADATMAAAEEIE